MAKKINYWQIGHANPEDVIWIMRGLQFEQIKAGSHAHETLFGKDYERFWRGRYEVKTGFCSIAPPSTVSGYKRPPQVLLNILVSHFSVVRFFYFADGVEDFTPNPGRKRIRVRRC
jgi:hypothetical protein